MQYVSPRLNAAGLDYLYNECYESASMSARYCNDDVASSEYDVFEKLIRDRLPNGGSILDVGCGVGMLLKRFQDDSEYKAHGFEFSESAAERARRDGLSVTTGQDGLAGFPDEAYDAVACLYVLEHVAQPVEFLAQMHRILKPGGLIFGVVPNYRYLRLRSDNPISLRLGGGHASLHPAEHLQNFTPSTFRRAYGKVGFRVVYEGASRPFNTGSSAMRFAKKIGETPMRLLAKAGYSMSGIQLIGQKRSLQARTDVSSE